MNQLRRLPRPLWFLFAGTVISRLGTFVVPYLTLYLSEDRGLSLATTGRVVACGGLGLLAGNVLGGWLSDRCTKRTVLVLSMGANAVGVAILGFSLPGSVAYGAALALALSGVGMYSPAANALIADQTEPTLRPFAYAVNYVGVNVGMGLGPLLAGLMVGSSFRWLFFGNVAAAVLCGTLIAAGIRGDATTGLTQPSRAAPPPGASRFSTGIVVFCIGSGFVVAPLMGLEYAVPLLVSRVFEAPMIAIGAIYSINALCILLLSFPIERVVRGRNELAMMFAAAGLWTLGVGVMYVGFSATAVIASTVVWTTGEIVASVVTPAFLARTAPIPIRGRVLSLPDAIRSLCAVASPLIVGSVWELHGAKTAVLLILALPATGAVAFGTAWLARLQPHRATAGS